MLLVLTLAACTQSDNQDPTLETWANTPQTQPSPTETDAPSPNPTAEATIEHTPTPVVVAQAESNPGETRDDAEPTPTREDPTAPPAGPFAPIPLDPSYSLVPYYYAQVTRGNAPVFASLAAADQGEPVLRRIEPGFVYVSYLDSAEVDGKRFYMIEPGIWMRANDLSRIGVPQTFQGLLFEQTPDQQFGWLRNQVESKNTPGYYPEDYTGQTYYQYTVVQIHDVQRADEMDWYLVAPDQWIEGRQISRVIPNPVPPEGVDNGRWIEVNLAEQTIAVYENHQLIFASMAATGREPTWTQPGLFQIYDKKEAEHMRGSFTQDRSDFYSLEDVPWTMYFRAAASISPQPIPTGFSSGLNWASGSTCTTPVGKRRPIRRFMVLEAHNRTPT